MIQQLAQVSYTYLTWRWIWFVAALIAIFTVVGFASSELVGLAIGMPCMIGLIYISAVAKWQYANPRARLMPRYNESHLGLFGILLFLLFVINPLLLSWIHSVTLGGLLAFACSLAGCILMVMLVGRGFFMLPALIIALSGYGESGHAFWFADVSPYALLRIPIAIAGGSMIGYSLWFLSRLNEEMDAYQTVPMGGYQLSRVERAEQRRLIGSIIKKQKMASWLSDRWLDGNLLESNRASSLKGLIAFGMVRMPSLLAALTTCVGFTAYCLILLQFDVLKNHSNSHPPVMLIIFATAIPPLAGGMALVQHRQRMGQELLRPATREAYIDSILIFLAKRTLLLSCGAHIAFFLITYITGKFPAENTIAVAIAFLIISMAGQFVGLAACVGLALWKSFFANLLGMYLVVAIQMGPISLWWSCRDASGWLIVPAILSVQVATGVLLLKWARGKWLADDLG